MKITRRHKLECIITYSPGSLDGYRGEYMTPKQFADKYYHYRRENQNASVFTVCRRNGKVIPKDSVLELASKSIEAYDLDTDEYIY